MAGTRATIAKQAATRTPSWMRTALRASITFLFFVFIYWICLRFIFPGYFAPLVPHHPDLYIPLGMLERSWLEVLTYPRPVAFVALRLMGYLGLQGSIAAVIVLVGFGVTLAMRAAEEFGGAAPSLIATALYLILLIAHPEFYFQHRHDVPAALSLLFLFGAVLAWSRWLGAPRAHTLAACLVFVALLALTKETYMGSLVILCLAAMWIIGTSSKKAVLGGLAAIVAIEVLGLVWNVIRYKHFLGASTAAGQAYALGVSPASIASGLWFYLRMLFSPLSLLIVVVAVALTWRDRLRLQWSLMFVLAGVAALLPNSALPGHQIEEYAWVAAPLVFLPILFLRAADANFVRASFRPLVTYGILAALTLGWIALNRPLYASAPRQWAIEQERDNARMMQSFETLRNLPASAHTILVAGMKASYHPWLSGDFIKHEFGLNRRWTVMVPRGGPERQDGSVKLTSDAPAINLARIDYALQYSADGNLLHSYDHAELAQLNDQQRYAIFDATLQTAFDNLARNPKSFEDLLHAGTAFLDWGFYDEAQRYLQNAKFASSATNPYPFFFLGQLAEAQHHPEIARAYYSKAVELDSTPPNPAFADALARVHQ